MIVRRKVYALHKAYKLIVENYLSSSLGSKGLSYSDKIWSQILAET